MDKILIVDDNQAVCNALALMLELNGYQTLTCLSPDVALELVGLHDVALVVQDMNFTQDTTSGEEGRSLFYAFRQQQPKLPIILLTAWTQLELAVELVKEGAADYMGKPWDDAKLLTSINNLISLHRLAKDNAKLSRVENQRMAAIKDADLCGIVFNSGAMQRCVDLALQIAKSDVSVLITGPNGAGKDKLADIIHANSSLKQRPFIKVNIGALPMDLLEAELFGAEAGAFTGATKTRIGRFEAADGGTLFLDEIGNLPLSGQVKLLRVLQTGEFERLGSHQTRKVNVRVLSATNADLAQDIQAGRFREDLFYRLNVIELPLPALKERKDDVLPLVEHFIGTDFSLSHQTQLALQAPPWPGNVRELENACRRAVILASSSELTVEDFGLELHSEPTLDSKGLSNPLETEKKSPISPTEVDVVQTELRPNSEVTSGAATARDEKASIESALAQHRGVIARVAKSLGLSRQALYRRMEKYGIDK
ncbi:sigma-54 dependent transcriptional regulator [Shewanella schlegeliana]|uniref:Sigma-54-dependent Fis family transcriptional regulator n=1 Tax=Shewanella schlegeliana TaxID=190308 RepID=A0ABS1T0W1_9GAMM|nr:sigma-54 dependent transcriptional regulator [Shewanella schlegeliana]MBL4914422.1 sigma-54-dependent Fis family transcriptional regulator [Shewanella schlegeliana]MCL1109354.1 sigma-54 dependent transcriptional regulator [Shewanella schlegeliana]GIU31714.1 sigma-54-dependent Fis family transcriptional regulator [Shewanella schlegeliana]